MTFNESNKENAERSRLVHEGLLDPTDHEKKCTILRKYITRGGFIQDRNGKWCKAADKVLVENANRGIDENLPCKLYWDKDEYMFRLEQDGILFGIEDTFIRLVEPCEPDICKDFEGEK